MLRTAANRAGCVYWSVAESRAFGRVHSARAARPLPPEAPAAVPTDAPGLGSLGVRLAGLPAWRVILLNLWQRVQAWLQYFRGPAAPPCASPRAATPPVAARAPSPAPLVSHPIAFDSDSDADAPDAAPILPPGESVAAGAAQPPPDGGLRLEMTLSRDIAAPLNDIARTICDSDQGLRWIDRCVESRLLLATTTGPIAYHRYTLPWVGDRDSVTRSTLSQPGPDSLRISIASWDVPEVPVPPGTTRLPWVNGNFVLEALTPELTSVRHTAGLVLGGSISRLLHPMIRRKHSRSPHHTLERLAALVESVPAHGAE